MLLDNSLMLVIEHLKGFTSLSVHPEAISISLTFECLKSN
jgi:hypothetical protein